MTEPPESPADPRPNGEPYYIDSNCPDCGTELVLSDEHRPTGTDARVDPEVWDKRETIFHDEWVCPECENGIHMDRPFSESDEPIDLTEDDLEPVSREEIEEALGIKDSS